jgi:hypothetical protein
LKQHENILIAFDFEDYKTSLDETKISKPAHLNFVKKEVKGKINIDSIYFSGNYASIYFKSITEFNPECLREICGIHKSIWNQRKVPFLYVSTPTELRIYNCFKEPIDPDKDLDKIDQLEIERYTASDTEKHLHDLVSILGRVAIDSGSFWQDGIITGKFDVKRRVDNVLVQNLKEAKDKLKKQLPDSVIHDILTRSLFILYLEDIKATDKKFYSQFKKDTDSYSYLLKDKEATYKFYKHLETKFNGNLFHVSDIEEKKSYEF